MAGIEWENALTAASKFEYGNAYTYYSGFKVDNYIGASFKYGLIDFKYEFLFDGKLIDPSLLQIVLGVGVTVAGLGPLLLLIEKIKALDVKVVQAGVEYCKSGKVEMGKESDKVSGWSKTGATYLKETFGEYSVSVNPAVEAVAETVNLAAETAAGTAANAVMGALSVATAAEVATMTFFGNDETGNVAPKLVAEGVAVLGLGAAMGVLAKTKGTKAAAQTATVLPEFSLSALRGNLKTNMEATAPTIKHSSDGEMSLVGGAGSIDMSAPEMAVTHLMTTSITVGTNSLKLSAVAAFTGTTVSFEAGQIVLG